jgi:hypothetical protein
VLLVAAWFIRARATARTFLAVVIVFGVFLPAVVYLAAVSVGDRLGGKTAFGNSSWGERADSLAAGFDLVSRSDSATHLLGAGVGQMSQRLKESSGLDAVFSVLLTYVFETGVVGALAAACVAHLLLRCWTAARYDMTFALVFIVWLIGITLITSYELLLPPWLTLGWLTVWPEIFTSGRDGNSTDARQPRGRTPIAPGRRKTLAHGVSQSFLHKSRAAHFPLSPVLRGEGRGEGLLPSDLGNVAPRTPEEEPLTLTLSPGYRGEGTGAAPATCVETIGVSRGSRATTPIPLLLLQPRRGVRIVRRRLISAAHRLTILSPLRGWGRKTNGHGAPGTHGLRRGLSSYAPPGLPSREIQTSHPDEAAIDKAVRATEALRTSGERSTPVPPWVVAVASRFRKRSALRPLLRHQHGRDARVTDGAQRNTGVPPVLAIRTALTSLLSFTLRRATA